MLNCNFAASTYFTAWCPLLFLQAAFMKAKSELVGRLGMTVQTRVRLVCAMRALSGVRESAVHPPTVNTQSKGNAACRAMVSYWITKRHVCQNRGSTGQFHHSCHVMFSIFCLQAVCFTVKSISMAPSLPMMRTPALRVTATEERWCAQRCRVTASAATPTNRQDNAAQSVNVCKGQNQTH